MTACRICGSPLELPLVDLGLQPLANELHASAAASMAQERFPLRARVCPSCWLVQLDGTVPPERMFEEYAYLSSYSTEWIGHVNAFADWAITALSLDASSTVVEIASNDGCLLQPFLARGVGVLGVDPAANVAAIARERGVPTTVAFLGAEVGRALRRELGAAPSLIVANNVLAHVPDLDDFLTGVAALAGPATTISIEVPHLLTMIAGNAFDTIYHEHHSYFSLLAVRRVLERNGLEVVDVVQVPTHGGSLRLLIRPAGVVDPSEGVGRVLAEELAFGLDGPAAYEGFARRVRASLDAFTHFLREAATAGAQVAGYGAAAKATVFLNAAGVQPGDITRIGDRNPLKVGRYVPGVGIPIVTPEDLVASRPDRVVVFAWNVVNEVVAQLESAGTGMQIVTAIPELAVHGAARS